MADAVGGALERYFRASGEPGDGELVFADSHDGRPLDKAAVLRRLRKALEQHMDEAHRFHDPGSVLLPRSTGQHRADGGR